MGEPPKLVDFFPAGEEEEEPVKVEYKRERGNWVRRKTIELDSEPDNFYCECGCGEKFDFRYQAENHHREEHQ